MNPAHAAVRPSPGMSAPGALAFSPDESKLTFLADPTNSGALSRQVMALDVASGAIAQLVTPPGGACDDESTLTLAEKLRRERKRDLATGVTAYAWAGADTVVFPLQGSVYAAGAASGEVAAVHQRAQDAAIDPRPSPDGASVAFVLDGRVHVAPIAGGAGESRAVTPGPNCGLADYISAEEMDQHRGFWWSPRSDAIAFLEVDDSGVGLAQLPGGEAHRFPYAGEANPRVRLGVVQLATGDVAWAQLGDGAEYIARVGWWPDGDALAVQVEDRAQAELRLLRVDARSGVAAELLREEGRPYVNLHHLFLPLSGGRFVWGSERSGWMHLYVYHEASLLCAATQGEWAVESVAGVDEQWVYFTGTRDSPLERHLYRAPLSGSGSGSGDVERITQEPGMHSVVMARSCAVFADTFSALDAPPRVLLRATATGEVLHVVHESRDPRLQELAGFLAPPEIRSFTARDGETTLYGAVYEPEGDGPFPTVVAVYGGPHVQTVQRSWHLTADLRSQGLRSRGVRVLKIDGRGSARRGLAFEAAIHRRMGNLEVDDQVDGVRALLGEDAPRVGVIGWSYGGYMTLMCLARAPEVFCAGVSGAPVTRWGLYDTHYTERYMGLPADNVEGYKGGSVMECVGGMADDARLMLVHGLLDENVHFAHTAELLTALVAAKKKYELVLFPEGRHALRRIEDREYLEERIADFLSRL